MRIDFNLVSFFFVLYLSFRFSSSLLLLLSHSNSVGDASQCKRFAVVIWNEAQHRCTRRVCERNMNIWIWTIEKPKKPHINDCVAHKDWDPHGHSNERAHTWSTTLHNSNSLTMHLNSFINSGRWILWRCERHPSHSEESHRAWMMTTATVSALPLFFGKHTGLAIHYCCLAFRHVSNSKLYTLWIYWW